MAPNFFDLSYLASGTPLQRKGLEALKASGVMDLLKDYDPVLAGTLPLDLFIKGSDLDILCFATDLTLLENSWTKNFVHQIGYEVHLKSLSGISSLIARFSYKNFDFELVAQSIATRQQVAYRHMVNEFHILEREDETFKQEIIRLKRMGMKTEPAFAMLLTLAGDPYEAILEYKI
ncbi:MAG TPA: DUF4269 domain-containing protein [Cyclobacteriaceae bacterium]|nr:DUF4269 domain-containing protein [Cyclobacteriaceae bacterium]